MIKRLLVHAPLLALFLFGCATPEPPPDAPVYFDAPMGSEPAVASPLDQALAPLTPGRILGEGIPPTTFYAAGTSLGPAFQVECGAGCTKSAGRVTLGVPSASYPLLAPDGTLAAPSYAFANQAGMGMYRSGASVLGLTPNGTNAYTFGATTLTLPASGIIAPTTGEIIVRDASNNFAFTTVGGVAGLSANNGAGAQIYLASQTQAWITTTDFSTSPAGQASLGANGAFSSAAITSAGYVNLGTDTSIFRSAANTLNVGVGGAAAGGNLTANVVGATGQVQANTFQRLAGGGVTFFTGATSVTMDIGASTTTLVMHGPTTFSTSASVTNLLLSATAPTISSGFGTSPSVSANNGTAAFRVNVGTGGTATSGVIGLPTATTGWNCTCSDITTASTTVFLCKQTASSTTTATIGNFNTAGAAAAWVASDIVAVNCMAL